MHDLIELVRDFPTGSFFIIFGILSLIGRGIYMIFLKLELLLQIEIPKFPIIQMIDW